jgi:hypothetical protein
MLIDALRRKLGDPQAGSFQLMGEALQLLTVEDLRAAVVDVPPELLAEEAALGAEAYGWLAKYNRSLYGRIAGYLELGERLAFRYPWPIVAILGIVQVLGGMDRARLYGLAGRLASRFGYDTYEKLGDGSEDVLRRTNRGIFADSVPTVLRALRAEALRMAGKPELAGGLLDGRAAVLWDEESRVLCRAIADGLAIADDDARFRALSATTLRHFAREQAIFTHHIGSRSRKRKLPPAKAVPAPVVANGRLTFRPFALPPGFDFRDHDTRVEAFGRAFVTSVTGSRADHAVAIAWVKARFSPRK